MPNVFITGASGYVGSTLMMHIPEDWNVTCLMRQWEHKEPFHLSTQITVQAGDLSDPNNYVQVPEGTDVVIHLAGIKGNFPFESGNYDPIFRTNVIGTHGLIESAKKVGVNRLVFASTYKVYYKLLHPMAKGWGEDDDVAPDEYYGLSKAVSENELMVSGLDYQILRFVNIFGYGGGYRTDDVVHTFIKSALTEGKIEIHGDGRQIIDLIDVGDVCKVLRAVVDPKMPESQIYNIGSGISVPIIQVAELVKDMIKTKFGKDVELVMKLPLNAKVTNRRISMLKFARAFKPYMELTTFGESFERYLEIMNDTVFQP